MIASFSVLYGHGDLHKRIKEVTAEIKKNPDNLSLYLKRGKLYLEHEEYDNALKDIALLREAGYEDKIWLIYEARCYNALAEYEPGLSAINSFLNTDPKNVRALRIKGSILYGHECYDLAIEPLDQVIAFSAKTLPENYLESAAAYMASDVDSRIEKATEVLELGINHLGNIPVLYEQIVNIHVNHGNLKEAIDYQTRIVEMMNRKENALYKRAEIWMSEGENDSAKKDLELAKRAIGALPERIKRNKATQDLLAAINSKLNHL